MKIAVYGSLRKGEYNYERFKDYFKDGLEYVRTTIIDSWSLYDLGSYPGIKEATEPNNGLIVDIMECSEACFDNIERMELGAGYRSEEIRVGDDICTIYVYEGHVRAENLVESGDWSEYLKEPSSI